MEGSGTFPKATDIVKVHYEGRLLNGQIFDSSFQTGKPLEIPLNEVISGWTEGVQKVSVGGKIRLYVPAALGYGDDGSPPNIPPASALIFEADLLEVTEPMPPVEETAPSVEEVPVIP